MVIKGRAQKMEEHKPTNEAQKVYDVLKTIDPVAVKALAQLVLETVNGIKGSSYSEIMLTTLYVAEDKVPHWLGGTELPESVNKTQERRPVVQVEQPTVQEKPDWAKFLNL